MKKILFLLFILSSAIYANETHVESDIVPRTVNFIIFIGLIYYLISDMVAKIFSDRQSEIIYELEKVEDKVKSAKRVKEEAEELVKNAHVKATEIIEVAKKETIILSENIAKRAESELANLEKANEDLKIVEENKVIRDVVRKSMNEILDNSEIGDNSNDVIKTLLRKVA